MDENAFKSLLQQLPSVIALPLQEYIDEYEPVLKLWHACDVVELILRLLVMIGLADLRRHGELPQPLLNELRSRIEEPTLGKWRGMAEAVAKHVVRTTSVVPELPSLVINSLVPLLDGPKSGPETAENSFTALRNRLAHGGGVTKAVATRLLAHWKLPFAEVIDRARWLAELDLIVKDAAGGFGVLRGPTTRATPYTPTDRDTLSAAFASEDAVASVRGATVLPLWPLKLYGVPRTLDPNVMSPQELAPQVYVRRGELRLQFTPVGSEEVCQSEADETAMDAFRALFRLDEAEAAARDKDFEVSSFEMALRQDAEQLIGRGEELDTLRAVVSATEEGVLWVWGPAGIGKSYLLARLAVELLENQPPQTFVLPYRFKVGDDRCSRESFLRFANERLKAWLELLPVKGEPSDADRQPKLLNTLRGLLGRLEKCRLLFILDGLDEVTERDPHFAEEVPFALREPGVTWLCAGRPERDLQEVFRKDRSVFPFPDGLPPMGPGDIRTMLLEKIGPLRKRLLKNDREEAEQIINPFVERVAEAAAGLPLYVKYVVGDVLGNRFRALDAGEQLPPSLEAYHEELLRRCAVGTLHQIVTPLAATLAAAKEPLSAEVLTALLQRRTLAPKGEGGLPLVRQGLSAIASMLRRAFTPEGTEGYTLYHHSLRQRIIESDTTRDAVELAREALCQAALSIGDDAADSYLYRQGVTHLLETDRTEDALAC